MQKKKEKVFKLFGSSLKTQWNLCFSNNRGLDADQYRTDQGLFTLKRSRTSSRHLNSSDAQSCITKDGFAMNSGQIRTSIKLKNNNRK